jgi:hypothetical protein
MDNKRWHESWASLLVVVSALACNQIDQGDAAKSYVVLTFKGAADRPIRTIEVNLTLGLRSDTTSFQAPAGGDIGLPTTAAIEIGSGEGELAVSARALASDGAEVAKGNGSGSVTAGQTASIAIVLVALDRDAGADVGVTGTGGRADSGESTVGGAGGTTTPVTSPGTGGVTSGSGGTTTPITSIGAGGATGAGGASVPPIVMGYRLTIAPGPLDFGPVPVGSESPPQTLTISNVGDQPAPALASLFVSDGLRFPISQDRCSGALLGPGFNCTAVFTFKPNSIGPLQTDGLVTLSTGQTIRFSLTGRGENTAPQIAMMPNTVDFTMLDVGISSPVDFKVTSTGGSAPGTLDILLNGSPGFGVVNNGCASVSLPKDGRCAFTLVFNPTTFGPAQVRIDAKSSSGASATSFATGIGRDFVQLSVKLAGLGNGTVTGGNLNCRSGNPCAIAIARTDPSALPKVELTAQPNPLSQFVGWSGPCGGTDICGLVMDGPKNVIATFSLR